MTGGRVLDISLTSGQKADVITRLLPSYFLLSAGLHFNTPTRPPHNDIPDIGDGKLVQTLTTMISVSWVIITPHYSSNFLRRELSQNKTCNNYLKVMMTVMGSIR